MTDDRLNKIYRLFATCVPVRGYARSIIADLHRHNIFYIPNSLFDLLEKYKTKTWTEISQNLDTDSKTILLDYLNFLESNELIFPLEKFELKRFPKLSMQWDFPSLCSNAIIDIGNKSTYNIFDAISKLNEINCFHLQIRFFKEINFNDLAEIIEFASQLSFRSIQIVIVSQTEINENEFEKLMKTYWKIAKIEIFNANQDKIIPITGLICMIILHSKKINTPNQCGCVDPQYFSIETNHFTEAQHHNTCLNRKIAIDEKGNIKNCPSMKHSYGHIAKDSIQNIITSADFQKLWFLKKDDISVCRVCEYRYICTDCRCFIKDDNDIYSQPAKCGYNPYICKWQGQKGYVPVEECGTYSKENGFVPNKAKIAELNKQIWEEDGD